MQHWQMEADGITYSATISACEKGHQWMTAVALLREMQHWHLEANVITYNATISACGKGQQAITAMSLLREMRQWNMKAHVIKYRATVSTCIEMCHNQHMRLSSCWAPPTPHRPPHGLPPPAG